MTHLGITRENRRRFLPLLSDVVARAETSVQR